MSFTTVDSVNTNSVQSIDLSARDEISRLPVNVSATDLSFAFTLSPASGIGYLQSRDDIEFLINGKSTFTLNRNNGQNTTNVTNVSTDDEGSIIQPMVYDSSNLTINDELKPPIMCISGLNDFGGEPGKIRTYETEESSGLFLTSVDIYYPWEKYLPQVSKLQATSDTAQILIGPRYSSIPGGSAGESGEVFATAGNILLIGASTAADYVVGSDSGGDGGGGSSGTPSYESGGSVYLLSGEGGTKSGEVLIATHDVQNWRLSRINEFTPVATEKDSGTIILQTGSVPDWHEWNADNGGYTGVGKPPGLPWEETGSSGSISLKTGNGSSTGDIVLKTGDTNTYTTFDVAVYDNDAGNISIIGGNISNNYTFTGPGPRHAGSVLIKGGDISNGTMSGISAGEVILKPGSLGNLSGIPNQALVRIASSSGLQIPYGSQYQRPAVNDNN